MKNHKKIQVVVGAVIQKKNKYLLTKRAEWEGEDKKFRNNPWQFPGGGLEFGESTIEGMRREIKEEVGVEVKIIKLLPKIYHEVRNYWHGVFICYLCELVNNKQQIILNEEASEYGWFTFEEIKKLPCLPKTQELAELL